MPLTSANYGMVYNIQRFSIHDGPGIRTTVFFKGCPLRCFWCQNPESQSYRPEIFFYSEKCIGCGACTHACPNKAVFRSIEGKVEIDRTKCSGCGICISVCPEKARTLMGKKMSVDEVMAEIMRDKNFYDNSNGGMTISGGDPVAQPSFSIALLQRAKQEGIHTLLETSAYASWDTFSKLIAYADCIYMDIKCINRQLHKKYTNVFNDLILENAVKAAAIKPVRVRVPVIPGFNDNIAEIKDIADFVYQKMEGSEIELLKYNELCESKYIRLDRKFEGRHSILSGEELEDHMFKLRKAIGAID